MHSFGKWLVLRIQVDKKQPHNDILIFTNQDGNMHSFSKLLEFIIKKTFDGTTKLQRVFSFFTHNFIWWKTWNFWNNIFMLDTYIYYHIMLDTYTYIVILWYWFII